MGFLVFISTYSIPFVLLYVIGYGILNKRNVYEDFVKGAADGFGTVIRIMPTLVGLMVAVGVLRASGFLELVGQGLGKALSGTGFPAELAPLVIVRMFSSSAATGLALDLFQQYGPDSYIGTLTSLLLSCTETVFYTMSVYFMTAKVTKSRYTLAGALLSYFAGVAASVVIAGFLSGAA